jgi:hypothetical protein
LKAELKMKFALGLVACIAIVFSFVTSPDKQPHASVDSESIKVMAEFASAVSQLQYAVSSQQDDMQKQMNARFESLAKELPAQFTAIAAKAEDERPPAPKSMVAMPDSDEVWKAIRDLEESRDELAAKVSQLDAARNATKSSYPAASASGGGGSSGTYAAKPAATTGTYRARWTNHDGLSERDHGIIMHGLDPNMSDEEMAMARDAYHDTYGPGHNVATSVNVNWSRPQATRSRTTSVQSPYTSSCPGGVCPTSRSTTVQSSGGLLGFGILGRRR